MQTVGKQITFAALRDGEVQVLVPKGKRSTFIKIGGQASDDTIYVLDKISLL